MSPKMFASFILASLFLTLPAIEPPSGYRFLNSVHDPIAETALLDYFDNNEPFIFSETNFFQPQCLLCENLGGEVCFGYKGGASYGIMSGTINTVRLVTNLPYIYSLGENVGASDTTVSTIAALRGDFVIPYRTLERFKGVASLDPILAPKRIVLRLCVKCLPGDTGVHMLTVTGDVDDLLVRLFVNTIAVNASNGVDLSGNKRAQIKCANQSVTRVESAGAVPDDSTCTAGSCLGAEFCLTYQPEYAATRETWCRLTEKNWVSSPENALKLSSSDSILPLHIQMERELLYQSRFTLILNPNWFIDYMGTLSISVPEATPGQHLDPVWRIVLPSTGQRPSNRRVFLLHNCADVRIRYADLDSDNLKVTTIFVDMKSNMTFTVKDNLNEAKRLCNEEILVAISNSTQITTQPQSKTTYSFDATNTSTPWSTSLAETFRQPSFVILLVFNVCQLVFLIL